MARRPPHVILAVDRPGWCFHRITLKLVEYLSDEFSFRAAPHLQLTHGECDILVNLWWGSTLRLKASLKARSVITCIYDCLSWNIDDAARHHLKLVLRHTDLLLVCNEEIADQIRREYPDGPEVMLCEDGVDTQLFKTQPLPRGVELGWAGNSQRMTPGGPDDQKGVEFLKAMARQSGISLNILDTQHGGAWPHKDMPKFYKDISWYACASFREGTPNPVLEAMACGRPVISTPVGLVPKLIRHGENGFIAERSPEVWRELLQHIKRMPQGEVEQMGARARKMVERLWSWERKAEQFRQAFRVALKQANRPKGILAEEPDPGWRAAPQKIPPPTAAQRSAARAKRKKNDPPRALLISDVPGWAFDQNMQDLELYLRMKFDFSHWYVIDFIQQGFAPDMEEYDVVFCVYHRWPVMNLLPWDRTLGSLRGRHLWPENPGRPTAEDVTFVERFRAFHVVTRESYEEFHPLCPRVVYLTNPVNMDRFPERKNPEHVVASWNGNARHGNRSDPDVKGFRSIVQPACQLAGVKLEYAEYNTKRLSPEEMPAFYQKGSVALCASIYEGASNSVMEAMAAGQAVISTAVGNIPEMRESQLKHLGDTGIVIVERTPEAFAAALRGLADKPKRMTEMGMLNRREIDARWSWKTWAPKYEKFLRMAL